MEKNKIYKFIDKIKFPEDFTVFPNYYVVFSINITFDYSLVDCIYKPYYEKYYEKFNNEVLYLRDRREIDEILPLFDDNLNCIDLQKFLKHTTFGSCFNFNGVELEHIKNISIVYWRKTLYNPNKNFYGTEHVQYVIRRNKR